nr:MAG TPA: hypothetical protein [Caudoviricetes sp.]
MLVFYFTFLVFCFTFANKLENHLFIVFMIHY